MSPLDYRSSSAINFDLVINTSAKCRFAGIAERSKFLPEYMGIFSKNIIVSVYSLIATLSWTDESLMEEDC